MGSKSEALGLDNGSKRTTLDHFLNKLVIIKHKIVLAGSIPSEWLENSAVPMNLPPKKHDKYISADLIKAITRYN